MNQSLTPVKSSFPFKRLLLLAIPEWKWLACGTLFLMVGSLTTLIYPQAIRMVIDQSLENKSLADINATALWLLVIFAVQGVAVSLRFYIYTFAGERIVARLRANLFSAISNREIAFFDKSRTGELLSRIASDTTVVQNTVTVNISMALRNGIVAAGGTALLVFQSGRLSALILLIVPPVALGTVYFGRKIRKSARATQNALAEANQVAEECLSSIRTVRAFSAEPHENQRYQSALNIALKVAQQRIRHVAVFQGIASFAGFAVIAGVLWYGGHLVFSGSMSIGSLTSFLLYTVIVAFSLAALGSLYTDFMRAGGAAERVFELIDQESPSPTQTQKIKTCNGSIQFNNVSFNYPTREDIPVLQEVGFHLEHGETVALVGPSGSGKSTVTKLLLGFYEPQEGEILIDGIPLNEIDMHDFRKNHVALVAQEPVLFSETIFDNIRYGKPDATFEQIKKAAMEANALEFIETFPDGFQTQVGEKGIQLSGGQKQRVAIARALLKDPAILLLDEATSALDSQSESLVKDALNRLMQSRTTLIIAHRLSTVKDANRLLVLDRGRVVQSGTHHDLLKKDQGIYSELIKNQVFSAE